MVDLSADLAPRRWLRVVGPVVVLVLVATGTFENAVRWYVLDKAAGIHEDVIGPTVEGLFADISAPSGAATTVPAPERAG